jgi:hypothetical protein
VGLCRCVLELHAIAAKKADGGGDFAVVMTAQERLRFLRGIKADPGEYYNMLGSVNAEKSECSRSGDRVGIHDGIRSSVGFVKLNRMVFGVLEEWMEGQLRAQVASCEVAGEESNAMEWNMPLACVLFDQGRYKEALELRESVFEFWRRVLPADHPRIGDGLVWSAAACSFAVFDTITCRLTCRRGDGKCCYNVLSYWKTFGSASNVGKCAGVQSSRAACKPS